MANETGYDIEVTDGRDHRAFLLDAYHYASKHSDDPVTQTGAVLVDSQEGMIVARGANHLPEGLPHTAAQLMDKAWKYGHMIHAEPSVIFDAARNGVKTEGTTMYMPWVPCVPCASAMVDAGIVRMIGHKEMIGRTPERWRESTNEALDVLSGGGIDLYMVEGTLGGVQNLMDGKVWRP